MTAGVWGAMPHAKSMIQTTRSRQSIEFLVGLITCSRLHYIGRLHYSAKEMCNDTNKRMQRRQLSTPRMTVPSNCHRSTYVAEMELNS